MIKISLEEALGKRRAEIIRHIAEGKVFIYPTDTVYGIGCSALNHSSVERIRKAKKREPDKPMSVIAPSGEWIEENAKGTNENMALAKSLLPGPYTVILNAKASAPKDAVGPKGTIAIRIPGDEFTKAVQESCVPFITTSANLSGDEPIKSISEIAEEIP